MVILRRSKACEDGYVVFCCAHAGFVGKISVEFYKVSVTCLLYCRDIVLCIEEACLAFYDAGPDVCNFCSGFCRSTFRCRSFLYREAVGLALWSYGHKPHFLSVL